MFSFHVVIVVDTQFTWGTLLQDLSRMNNKALKIKQQLAEGKYEDATNTWGDLRDVILEFSNNVVHDFYNFLLDDQRQSPVKGTKANGVKGELVLIGIRDILALKCMNQLEWGGQDRLVFPAMAGDFMKPRNRIQEVDELLAKGINITIYVMNTGGT
ncbi:hypothetical protein Tsubulata_033721, partial [Turnera subulata]